MTTESGAPQVASGWSSKSLGEGMFAITAPGASVRDVTSWSTLIGARGFEPDRIITSATLPNNPSFSRLWGLNNTGQTGGVGDADIDAPEAWNVTTGSRAVVVAVINTGIDYRHRDLAAPGVGIFSTTPNNSYASYSGTSMAAPHGAGLVALMAAADVDIYAVTVAAGSVLTVEIDAATLATPLDSPATAARPRRR